MSARPILKIVGPDTIDEYMQMAVMAKMEEIRLQSKPDYRVSIDPMYNQGIKRENERLVVIIDFLIEYITRCQ